MAGDIGILAAVSGLGSKNLYGIGGIIMLVGNAFLLYRWDILEKRWNQVVDYTNARQTAFMQRKVLSSYCQFLSQILSIPVSVRAFESRVEKSKTGQMETRLYQVRDLFVENEPFAQETAYTYIQATDSNFVAARAYTTRAPKFELLPEHHTDMYDSRTKNMVEPTQKWVLAAPILRFDLAGTARDELAPRGVIVFYGKQIPKAIEGSPEWEGSRTLSRDAAEFFANLPMSGHDRNQII
jgi:hypothetical protein